MIEIIVSIIFFALMLFLFLRMIFYAISSSKSNSFLVRISQIFTNKTNFIFNKIDNSIPFSIGKIRLSYILIILLLMLLQKLIFLVIKNG